MKLAGILTYMTMVGSESPKSDKDPQKRIAMLVSRVALGKTGRSYMGGHVILNDNDQRIFRVSI